MKKNLFRIITILALMLLVLSACNSNETKEVPQDTDTETEIGKKFKEQAGFDSFEISQFVVFG